MRSLLNARRDGLALRLALDPDLALGPLALYDRLVAYLWDTHRVEAKAVVSAKVRDGRAEVKGPCLFYNIELDADPVLRVRVIAHEVGHVERHDRLRRLDAEPDPTTSGTYTTNERVPAVARYTRKSREESEADAFALEFACPADAAMRMWRGGLPDTKSVAAALGVAPRVARAQLVEGLYRSVTGTPLDVPPPDPWTAALNEDQGPAAAHDAGRLRADEPARRPALVVAGPGCGKTTTLVARALWAVQQGVEAGLDPNDSAKKVLALTFSNEAAGEFASRITAAAANAGVSEETAGKVTATTFHSFCRMLLSQHGHRLDPVVDESAPILGEAAQEVLILHVLGDADADAILDLKDLQGTAASVRRHLDYLKQRLDPAGTPWSPAAFRTHVEALPEDEDGRASALALGSVFEEYEAAKQRAGALDFSDLISLSLTLFETCPDIRDAYRSRFAHVVVDEFQDVSRAVSALLQELCGPDNPPWVVGDPNQTIYQFLNAAPENVTEFGQAFDEPEVYRLRHTYRSTAEVIRAANQLATLLGDPDAEGPACETHLVAGADVSPLPGGPTVTVAVAASDRAEYEGVARQVAEWVRRGAAPEDIAVLCRRNVDVRDVVLALADHQIRAVAAGLMTPEGAAGDLAVVATLHDGGSAARRAGLARLAHALGRRRYSPDEIDAAVADLCSLVARDGGVGAPAGDASALVTEVVSTHEALACETFFGDAFDMMAAFLFDASDFLRRLLDDVERGAPTADDLGEVIATLRLSESLTALSQAAAHRSGTSSEGDADERARSRRQSRRVFGDHLRQRLTDATPTARTPQRIEGAVQVMTCHAAKGLEFPCVCVVGQTRPQFGGKAYPYFPSNLQPPTEQEDEQANALLFVGVTRAERALAVSYAEAKSVGGRARTPTPLLLRWTEGYGVPVERWEETARDEESSVPFGPVWGRRPNARFDPRDLDSGSCALDAYIRSVARVRLPEGSPPLYPRFLAAVRGAVGRCVPHAYALGRPLLPHEAEAHLQGTWGAVALEHADHPHRDLFDRFARRAALGFARAFEPSAQEYRPIDLRALAATADPGVTVPLKLAAAYTDGGRAVAILVRVESYARSLSADGSGVLWSKMSSSRRLPFVLLRDHHPDLVPKVYSITDDTLYDFKFGPGASVAKTSAQAASALEAMIDGEYAASPSAWSCDRCRSRTVCPHWLRSETG
ncbi:UvrD-helicase domain-containing protein [Rubrivirga sp.]|uniref:UvrD-helicase domain-containing protein n=1 Tax=Rubrivirga sp. TaxID=1885344 RepID=UPI003C781874